MAADTTASFRTAPVPDRVRSFRTQRPDRVRGFGLAPRPDAVRGFRTLRGDKTRSFATAPLSPAPAGVSFVVDQETGLVTLTYTPASAVTGPLTATVTRLRDEAEVPAEASGDGLGPLSVSFGTEQDGVYHLRLLDADGTLLLDVYLPVMPRAWRCWREENHRVGTGGRSGEGEAVSPAWEQLLARIQGAEALARVLDPAPADALILSLSAWCSPEGCRPHPPCSC